MKKTLSAGLWLVVAFLGAAAYAVLALRRAEPINSVYILVAALCTYTIGYRFYAKWIAARVLGLNDRRATPCEVHDDGRDFVKTNKWIVFGHHFAAISGPGPLVGPVLAAQFGYLPGTLWILIGVVLGGAVQDFVILFCSMRRGGRSLGQMVKDEMGNAAGAIGIAAILAIMIILLAVLALVVVKALADSPWGVFTVAATIPVGMLMGGYLRFWRVGKVMEASAFGIALLLLSVWGGQFVHGHATLSKVFTLKAEFLAWCIILYGLAASVLPVWLLLAPRDYLSTFMKLGTIFALAFGVLMVLPDLQMPPITKFIDGTGPVVAGKLFPFCFITIACGAISGFHTLISSGTTPKIITRENYARPIGYGAMCLESLVAIMALIAACTLEPGVYLSMNIKGAGPDAAAVATDTIAKVRAAGFTVTPERMSQLADAVQEKTLYGRTGGAATLAVGMANIFSNLTRGRWLDIWYHFAIMFEALFILTTLDAGTRVGRYLLQDTLGHVWKPLGETRRVAANVFASVLVVAAWGYFLVQGVRDPLGGINSLWPLFGIANQLLASVALCFATTVILKMQLAPKNDFPFSSPASRILRHPSLALVTLVPLVWLLAVTMTAGAQKIFHSDARIGFLAAAEKLDDQRPTLEQTLTAAKAGGVAVTITAAERALRANTVQRFNSHLDAVVAGLFLCFVTLIVVLSLFRWSMLLARKHAAQLSEANAVWLPDYAVAEAKSVRLATLIPLSLALLRELSGEAKVDRIQQHCACAEASCGSLDGQNPCETNATNGLTPEQAYVRVTEERFNGIHRCC